MKPLEINLEDFGEKEIDIVSREGKLLDKLIKGGSIVIDTSKCQLVEVDTNSRIKKDNEKVLEILKLNDNAIICKTFGYVGSFTYDNKITFNITYRFGEKLLNRMIAVSNGFDFYTIDHNTESNNAQSSYGQLSLYLNFILQLEKLATLGLPKIYTPVRHHGHTLKGKVDINRFIKKDIPFLGRISSVRNEQHYVQEIIDLLHAALVIVEKSQIGKIVSQRVFQIRNLTANHANNRFVNEHIIQNALNHKSIRNSLYAKYKPVLKFAEFIIKNTSNSKTGTTTSNSLIFDVSLLWESYLYNLLKNKCNTDGCEVLHEDPLLTYKDSFFERYMYPDITIKKDGKVLVLDAKSKRMNMCKGGNFSGGVKRDDFYQIHTYMSYYNNQEDLIGGGLLYPITKELDKNEAYSDNWLGDTHLNFFVDGIDNLLNIENDSPENFINHIVDCENKFTKRIFDVFSPE
jgi:5-methylcytosine-specific restriction endonuclease McrBC regulatory subunit McrC